MKGYIGASPKTVVFWSVTGSPPDHPLVNNFTCMNPGDPIPHNHVVDYRGKNYRSRYSPSEDFYSRLQTI